MLIPGNDSVKFKKDGKGQWTCEGIHIYCNSVFDGLAIADKAMEEADKILVKRNKIKEVKTEEKKTTLPDG